jgi:hypothetical protein
MENLFYNIIKNLIVVHFFCSNILFGSSIYLTINLEGGYCVKIKAYDDFF